MVLRCVSRSRRWKSANIRNTHAPSAARPLLRGLLSVSGIARAAERSSLAVLTCYRTFNSFFSDENTSRKIQKEVSGIDGMRKYLIRIIYNRTPAAAASRSTIRRLREIAEV